VSNSKNQKDPIEGKTEKRKMPSRISGENGKKG